MLRKTVPELLHVSCVSWESVRRSSDWILPCAKSASATSWPEGNLARAPRSRVRTGSVDGSGNSILFDSRMVEGDKPCKGKPNEVSMNELEACGPEVGNPSKNVPHSIM